MDNKVFHFDTLCKITEDLKGSGLKIGLTHGAYDLFHTAHLNLLTTAARACDFLIVSIDCDEMVRKFKGELRPVNNQMERLATVTAISHVSAAFINDFAYTPEEYSRLYSDLNTDIVFVGYAFGFKDVIEEQVKQGGAKLIRIDTKQSPSTSRKIEDIIARHAATNQPKVEKLNR